MACPLTRAVTMASTAKALALLAIFFATVACGSGTARPQVPAIYVFGDSTADVGNNNDLTDTTAKANFPHNGIDFPRSRPTGRFSNGYNGIDFLAVNMGFRRSPPPFRSLDPKSARHQLYKGHRGASFASGGSGILDSTGDTITMTQQIEDFKTLRSRIITTVGAKKMNVLLSKSIFLISSGGNDIFDFFNQNPSANTTDIQQFVASTATSYNFHIQALYHLGARKFGVIDVPPIGCCPYSRRLHPSGLCIEAMNDLALVLNNAARAMLQSLGSTMTGMKYSVGSSNTVVQNIIADPQPLGFTEVRSACCGYGEFGAEQGCIPNSTYCGDRRRYLFWDMIHPTHATSKLAAWAFYGGSTEYAAPINFKQLVEALD